MVLGVHLVTFKEFCIENTFSLTFSTQHAFDDRRSFQVLWSISLYNEKCINLSHSIDMRLKHLLQITLIP